MSELDDVHDAIAIDEVQADATALVTEAQAIVIETDDQAQEAGEFLRTRVKAVLKEVEATFKPMQQAADKTKREIMDQRHKIERPLKEAERVLKASISEYVMEQRRIAEEEQRRAEAAERARAEEERLREAERLEKEGHDDEAEAVIETPAVAEAPPPVKAPVKVKGVGVKEVWAFRFTNPKEVKPDYLVPHEKLIAATVKNLGKPAEKMVGGIEVYRTTQTSSRAQ